MPTSSVWIDEFAPSFTYPKLVVHVESEVCVIGGGITGVLTAYYLAREKRDVTLIEGGVLGHGETGYTTAFVTHVVDAPLYDLRKKFGDDKAAQVWASGRDAINELERIIKEENIECEFTRCSVRIYATSERDVASLHEQTRHAKEFGYEFVLHPPSERFPWGYIEMQGQAKFHPRKFLLAVAAIAVRYGAKIYENSPVTQFEGKEGNIVATKFGSVTAHEIVEATHAPIDNPIEVPSRLEPFQSYVIEAKVPKGLLDEGIYWDTEDPYHYFRIDPKEEYDRLILGGEDHKTGEAIDQTQAFVKLETYARWLLPDIELSVVRRWSGQILETPDGLPFIGRSITNSHHTIATGYAGDGMTFGVVAAMTISDIIAGRENPWIQLYSPFRLKGTKSILRMGFNYVKEMVVGRLQPRGNNLAAIGPGGGAVIVFRGQKVAVSKDVDGSVTMVSAVCTHLGCVVNWNTAERTWDCPCHGSRFKKDGSVMSGPAKRPLEPVKK